MTVEFLALFIAPWVVLIIYCAVVWWFRPSGVSAAQFFRGGNAAGSAPAIWVLVFSAAITWVFAKSIDNVAGLSQAFGITGGIGYAVYFCRLQ